MKKNYFLECIIDKEGEKGRIALSMFAFFIAMLVFAVCSQLIVTFSGGHFVSAYESSYGYKGGGQGGGGQGGGNQGGGNQGGGNQGGGGQGDQVTIEGEPRSLSPKQQGTKDGVSNGDKNRDKSENADEYWDGKTKKYSPAGEISTDFKNDGEHVGAVDATYLNFPNPPAITEEQYNTAIQVYNDGVQNGLSVNEINQGLKEAGVGQASVFQASAQVQGEHLVAPSDGRQGNFALLGLNFADGQTATFTNDGERGYVTSVPPVNYHGTIPDPPYIPQLFTVTADTYYVNKNTGLEVNSNHYSNYVGGDVNYQFKPSPQYTIIGRTNVKAGDGATTIWNESYRNNTPWEVDVKLGKGNSSRKSITYFVENNVELETFDVTLYTYYVDKKEGIVVNYQGGTSESRLAEEVYTFMPLGNYEILGCSGVRNDIEPVTSWKEEYKDNPNIYDVTLKKGDNIKSVTYFIGETEDVPEITITYDEVDSSVDYNIKSGDHGIITNPFANFEIYDLNDEYGQFNSERNVPGKERLEFKGDISPFMYEINLKEIDGDVEFETKRQVNTWEYIIKGNDIVTQPRALDNSPIEPEIVKIQNEDLVVIESVNVCKLTGIDIYATNVNASNEEIQFKNYSEDSKITSLSIPKPRGTILTVDEYLDTLSGIRAQLEEQLGVSRLDQIDLSTYKYAFDDLNTDLRIGNLNITSDVTKGIGIRIKGHKLTENELNQFIRGESNILIDDLIEVKGGITNEGNIIPGTFGNGYYNCKYVLTYESDELENEEYGKYKIRFVVTYDENYKDNNNENKKVIVQKDIIEL